jgi:TetR/AcrR family transcriptional regulator, ethionamide resistance regulator
VFINILSTRVNSVSTSPTTSELAARRVRRREQRRRGEDQEDAILDATERLLAEHRFSDLNAGMVAKVAGLSRPALYFYFGSMDELLVALVTRGLDRMIASIEAVEVGPDATPGDVLALGIARTGEMWRAHRNLLRTAVEHAHRLPAVYAQWRSLLDRGVDLYVQLMAWSAKRSERPTPDAAVARRHAELCMLLVGHALDELHARPHRAADARRLEDDLLAIVRRALKIDV